MGLERDRVDKVSDVDVEDCWILDLPLNVENTRFRMKIVRKMSILWIHGLFLQN